ncbi:MAG: UDP-N-acetylmuramoyl-tripeptide--D-alanyl-D-alanine ligase [Treponema sp.]|nr:UDP-N-acetylmuramoyl-tripeptide--D-alanyl-D-alanine ligase [Treponema sp.]
MNTELMGADELSRSIGGRLLSFSPSPNSPFNSVSIDSRLIKERGLFFAIEGASCDGHGFVEAAFSSGAQAAVVESSKLESFNIADIAKKHRKDLILVQNTLKALQDSAIAYLKKFPALVKIAITGSSGKTTTKEIAASIISCEKNTLKNEGNFNSESGLPLSVFNLRSCHEVGVFELGMNKKGEISALAEILRPNIAQVTNIGHAHVGFFGSRNEILKEKKCVFKFMTDNDIALIPKDDELAGELAQGVMGNIHYFGEDTFAEFEGALDLGLEGTEITWAGEKIRFALAGKHNLANALAAIAIAKELNVGNDSIKKGLESVKPLFGRAEILKGRTTVIRDCYNANPESMVKSIEFCDSLVWDGRKVYVLADMLELGDVSFSAHTQLGDFLTQSKADRIFLFGSEIKAAASCLSDRCKSFFYTDDMEQLSAALDGYVQSKDIVLLKGSRGCALERLSEILTEVKHGS